MVVTPAGAVMPSDCENAVPVCAENVPPGTTGAGESAVLELPTSALSNAVAFGVPQPVTVS